MATRTWMAVVLAITLIPAFAGPTSSEDAGSTDQAAGSIPRVSLEPEIRLAGASNAEAMSLVRSVRRFTDLGLELPDLEVGFSDERNACGGAYGRFSTREQPWRIAVCSDDLASVLEHELAHAWERANLSDATRRHFMARNGYTVWDNHAVPWNERAMEAVAVIVQQGVSGPPLPPSLGRPSIERLASFELLTGQIDPRLAEWVSARVASCADRPTPLSLGVPDARGQTCPRRAAR